MLLHVTKTARCLALFLLGAFACPLVVPAAAPPGYTGKVGVYIPPRTDEGTWDGTWYSGSVEAKIALWMRTKRGKPEVRVKYVSGRYPLSFETDWKGIAAYYNAEQPAEFALKMSRSSANEIDGTWKWDARMQNASRNESGDFNIYRALDGRLLVMEFTKYELALIQRDKTIRSTKPPLWTFVKASKRQVLWDELPF